MAGGRPYATGAGDGEPGHDPLVAGLPGAVALLTAHRSDPRAPLGAAVVGPGGSGKSALISALVRSARRRGLATRRIRRGDTVPFPSDDDALLLVDDAHALDEGTLAELTDVAEDPDARLVVAARPWPCPRALSTLWLALGRARAPVALEPLTATGVEERMAAVLGSRCPPALAVTVSRLSGGSPAVVDRLATQSRDAGPRFLALAAERGSSEIPAGVLDLLRHEVQGLDDDARRLLLALAVGAPRVPAALADVLGVDRTTLDDLLNRARASGLLLTADTGPELGAPAERIAPLACRTLVRLGAADQRLDLERRIAEQALARGASVLAPARRLLGSGLRGGDLPRVFTAAGDEALASAPHVASALYADAVAAGAAPESLVLPRAEASALAGDLDVALRLADPLVSAADDAVRTRAVGVVATVMSHRGMGRTATAMLAEVPPLRPWAVPGLVGGGFLERAQQVHDDPDDATTSTPVRSTTWGSTTLRSAVVLTAQGVLASLRPDGAAASAALSDLTRAAALVESLRAGALLPESPAALAALVALHSGEVDLADSVLRRALDSSPGGPALAPRHHLLRAWVAMLRGDVAGARQHVATARGPRAAFEPRDELPAAALDVGIARRSGDSAALRTAWTRAREALVRHPVDLFMLLPLGELAVGAARLKEQAAVGSAWDDAEALLAALGHPPLWRAASSWYGLAAAITAGDVPGAERHLVALVDAAGTSPLATALADAARQWLAALSGDVDPDAVEAAARGLHRLGWAWDGARLAGEAAIRTHDRRAMASLLACARSLSDATPTPDGPGAAAPPVPTSGLAREAGEVTLSDREREVARLVLAGLTHKQIGARLYISSKTVEHHVARMRQRLESNSRGEMFAQLRELVGDPAPGSSSFRAPPNR